MNESCICVRSDYDKKRLTITLKRYKEIKNNPDFTTETAHLYAQLCGYSDEDFREIGEEKPRELKRTLGKVTQIDT